MTGHNALRGLGFFLALVACLLSVGCAPGQLYSNLQLALDAIQVAFPVISAAAGLPPDVVAVVSAYLGATNDALGKAITILSGPGSDAQKAAAITAAFAGIAKPIIPAQYQAIAGIVQTIAQKVADFLASLPTVTPGAALKTQPLPAALTAAQTAALAKAQTTYAANAAKITALKAK